MSDTAEEGVNGLGGAMGSHRQVCVLGGNGEETVNKHKLVSSRMLGFDYICTLKVRKTHVQAFALSTGLGIPLNYHTAYGLRP